MARPARSCKSALVLTDFSTRTRPQREARLWYLTAHQKGARKRSESGAARRFCLRLARRLGEPSTAPALLMWGRNAMSQGFDSSPEWLALRPDVQLAVVSSSAMLFPHLEQPQQFCEIVRAWLSKSKLSSVMLNRGRAQLLPELDAERRLHCIEAKDNFKSPMNQFFVFWSPLAAGVVSASESKLESLSRLTSGRGVGADAGPFAGCRPARCARGFGRRARGRFDFARRQLRGDWAQSPSGESQTLTVSTRKAA